MAAAKAEIEAFQYMLLLRGATTAPSCARSTLMFQYMHLLRGATGRIQNRSAASMFQYMLLLRGATFGRLSLQDGSHRFNTCSSCEEQLAVRQRFLCVHVSIHAPLARSNTSPAIVRALDLVSIHAPLARSNCKLIYSPCRLWFQYMLLLRGATRRRGKQVRRLRFNTCSSCEEQLENFCSCAAGGCFNTCSSCEEQLGGGDGDAGIDVSIHAPLARSNKGLIYGFCPLLCFNTCSSCEEQLFASAAIRFDAGFNTCSSCEEQLLQR